MARNWNLDELSDDELELLLEYINQTTESFRTTVADVLTQPEPIESKKQGAEDVFRFTSDSVSATESQLLSLKQMKAETLHKYEEFTTTVDDLPENAKITPDMLNRLLVKKEVISYFQLIGTLLEKFTIELVMEEVVTDDRQSNSTRSRVEGRSQEEREWLLYITGVIDNGTKSEIRRSYSKRNSLVHDSEGENLIEEFADLESDVNRAYNAVDELYEEIHGISIEMMMGNLLVDE